MNCETCQFELDDLLDGETTVARAQVLRAHLSTCAVCAAQWQALTDERALFAQFAEQTALEPTPALWRGIAARIADETPDETPAAQATDTWSSRWQRWRAAWLTPLVLRQLAGAAALVVLSVAATTLYFKAQQPMGIEQPLATKGQTPTPTGSATPVANDNRALAQTETTATSTASQQFTSAPPMTPHPRPARFNAPPAQTTDEAQQIRQQLARAEREYQTAIRLLDRVIARQRTRLAPALVAQYESSLALIDQSIAQSRRALRENTQDAATGQFLLAAYAKKLELLQDIAMQTGQ